MERVHVRPEAAGDAEAIDSVIEAAFGRSLERVIVDGVRGTDRWIEGGSLVAVDPDGEIVGHVLLSEGDLEDAQGSVVRRIWMIGPVSVRPDRQGIGIGSALMHAAIAFATDREQPVLCLLGHADYYPRFGFAPARSLGIEPPAPWADANWLALPLPGWDGSIQGVARFPPAFDAG